VIGLFDSGLGGLSVLQAVRAALPTQPLVYFADSRHERSDAFVTDRAQRITHHLASLGCRVVVVACNTATAIAIDGLRQQFAQPLGPRLVGVEPAIKPAAALSRGNAIAVMATPATLASARFAALCKAHAPRTVVTPLPCPGLADAIEGLSQPQGDAMIALVTKLLAPHASTLNATRADTLALGCTHYPLVRASIERALQGLGLGNMQLVDNAQAVAAQTRAQLSHWEQAGADRSLSTNLAVNGGAMLRLQTSGNALAQSRVAQLLTGQTETFEQVTV
jgi:glutamate racemase